MERPNLKPEKRAELEADLHCPELPKELAYLWQAFSRLHRRRQSNGFGYNPISWYDLDAYTRHTRTQLAPWEVLLLEEIDDLWLAEQNKERE